MKLKVLPSGRPQAVAQRHTRQCRERNSFRYVLMLLVTANITFHKLPISRLPSTAGVPVEQFLTFSSVSCVQKQGLFLKSGLSMNCIGSHLLIHIWQYLLELEMSTHILGDTQRPFLKA